MAPLERCAECLVQMSHDCAKPGALLCARVPADDTARGHTIAISTCVCDINTISDSLLFCFIKHPKKTGSRGLCCPGCCFTHLKLILLHARRRAVVGTGPGRGSGHECTPASGRQEREQRGGRHHTCGGQHLLCCAAGLPPCQAPEGAHTLVLECTVAVTQEPLCYRCYFGGQMPCTPPRGAASKLQTQLLIAELPACQSPEGAHMVY